MRLLYSGDTQSVSFTEDLPEDRVPPYAILSHRWGPDGDEVKFADVINGTATNKPGYDKVLFCLRQAQHNGLQYCWIDTCCIDKSNSTELSKAINSMFRWYQNAKKCCVYLSDVPRSLLENSSWEDDFCASSWFTRGWTLQELLAPKSVDFFSSDGKQLGSKSSLEEHIRNVTGIPAKALRGDALSTFTIQERFSWQDRRTTTEEEDRYYSLLGIMDVSMNVIYGEGAKKARTRLEREIREASKGKCSQLEDFSVTFSLANVVEVDAFVARRDELARVRDSLISDGSRRYVVLHGLGGIGKTQLSVAYAKRHRDDYSAVLWFNIKDDNSVKSHFVRAAKQILRDHPSASRLSNLDLKDNIDAVVDAVKAWLSLPRNTRWLLIFDNYDRPKLPGCTDSEAVDVRNYLPEAHQGSVIITTRSAEVDIGHPLLIKKLDNLQDSLSILESSSQRPNLLQDSEAERLARKLDGLPLALATAGTYLRQTPTISCADYLRFYEDSWAKLQRTSPGLTSYEDRMLYSTWQISFNQIEKQSPLAANLLRLWAYFDNQDLWFELLRHAKDCDLAWLQELTSDELEFHNHVRVLCNHGLVEKDIVADVGSESHGYSIHACLHAWAQTVLNKNRSRKLEWVALHCIALHVPDRCSWEWWTTSRRLLNHAAIYTNASKYDWHANDAINITFHSLEGLYSDQGKLDEAERMYRRAWQRRKITFGADHASTMATVNGLSNLYAMQEKLNKAEQMYERALRGCENDKMFGAYHLVTLQTVSNLGNIYDDQGKLCKAEERYERALRWYESNQTPGADYALIPQTVTNLANLYFKQGKLSKAEKMYERALRLHKSDEALGANHTFTLQTVNNLGSLYVDQGKLDKAEEMYEQVLQGFEQALGADHVSTLGTLNCLGNLYLNQGKLEKAEQTYKQALRGYEKVLGADNSATLITIGNLGNLYKKQEKLDEAEHMYERALQGCREALGADHNSTLLINMNLGTLYMELDKLDKAEQTYGQVIRGYEKMVGPDHPSTLQAVVNLGVVYATKDRLIEAEQLLRRALKGYSEVYKPDHPELRRCYHGLLLACMRHARAHSVALNRGRLRISSSLSASARDQVRQAIQTNLSALHICSNALLLESLGIVGRIWMWLDDMTHAVTAFQYWKSLCRGPSCDICRLLINGDKHFVCKSCLDVDLCQTCFQAYTSDIDQGEAEQVPQCVDHSFLEVPSLSSMTNGDRMADALAAAKWIEQSLNLHATGT